MEWLHTVLLQGGDLFGSVACWAVAVVLLILLALLFGLSAWQQHAFGKKPVYHLCEYCGHLVRAVSSCHHAPVKERFLGGVCLECKAECRLVCERCKRPV